MCLGLDCAFFFIWNYAQHSSSGTRSLLTLRKASLKKKLQGSLLKKRFRTKQGRHSFCHQYKVFISIRLKLMLLGKRLLESDISTHLSWERQNKSYWVHCWHCSKKPFRICILIAQPIQPIFTHIGLHWLCYLAGKSWMAPRLFFSP